MSNRLLLAAAGALVLSVVYVPSTNAGSGAQECLARMGNEKMTAAEWTACACHGVTQLTDLHSLAQVAATKSDVCAGIASDRLVQLLAQPGAGDSRRSRRRADDAVATDAVGKKVAVADVGSGATANCGNPMKASATGAAVRLRSSVSEQFRAQELRAHSRRDRRRRK